MKTCVLTLVLLLMGSTLPALAQQQTSSEETIVVKKSDLTPDQLARLQNQAMTAQLQQYSQWADIGKGIGMAVGESLRQVKDVAVDFSQTDVGKFTMFLIAWKIMAQDVIDMGDKVIGYLVGIPTLFIGALVWVWSYRRQCLPRRVLVEKTKDSKKWAMYVPGGGLVNVGDPIDTKDEEERAVWAVGHVVVGLVFVLICSLMIFGC